jgi:serine/threonine protein kinase
MSVSSVTLGGLPIAAGDVLLKKYRVERLIGEGGTGIVVSATHVQLQQRVAIKFLRRALESDELRTRFDREARATGKIESEHVVLVLDTGTLDDGAPYMVMEHLEGRDLAHVLKEDGPLPVEKAVDCMLQVCEALEQAHAIGIVHRDLKPANLFLVRRDDGDVHVKVVDFGISKILDRKLIADDQPHDVTSSFTVLGSPRYMAPEQVKSSKDVDGRADLWSVGAVLFQLVTGRHAFEAENNVQASLAVLTAEPQSLCALAPHAPRDLEAVVNRCLTKDIAQRFQSAAELAEALRPFASDRAKESLDRLRGAKQAPSLKIALGIAKTSTPPQPDGGSTEAELELAPHKLRLVDTSLGTRIDPSFVRPPPHAPRSRELVRLGVVAFVLVLGGMLVVSRMGRAVQAAGASSRSAVVAEGSSSAEPRGLDAGPPRR